MWTPGTAPGYLHALIIESDTCERPDAGREEELTAGSSRLVVNDSRGIAASSVLPSACQPQRVRLRFDWRDGFSPAAVL